MTETVVAAIDIGSNSVHLLIAEMVPGQPFQTLVDENTHLDLGLIVQRQGRMGAEARRAACAVVEGYVARARDAGVEDVVLMGTQPLRRASDRSLLRRAILAATGIELTVLSHAQEAGLTLLGVTGGAQAEEPIVVMDVGGGSSEVILVGPGVDPVTGAFAVGSSRLSAVVVEHDPPTSDEIAELRRRARTLVDTLPSGAPTRGIVSGGSGTNVSRLLGRERTTPVDRADLESGLELLAARPAADLAADTGLTERRVRQLAAGIAIVSALLERYGLAGADVSDAGLREGAVLAAGRVGPTRPDGVAGWDAAAQAGAAKNRPDGA